MKRETLLTLWSIISMAVATGNTLAPSCMPGRSLSSPSPQPGLVNCPQYRSMSCCSVDQDSRVLPSANKTQLYGFNWDRCGPMSDACLGFFQAESCYFECDPYQWPWGNRAYSEPQEFAAVPVCSYYCEEWYNACKNDYTCGAEWLIDFVPVNNANGTTIRYDCPSDGVCKKFSEVFTSPQGLCDILWGSPFYFSDDLENCVVWDFPRTIANPNQFVTPVPYDSDYCEVVYEPPPTPSTPVSSPPGCLADRDFVTPKPVPGLKTCSAYSELSCCGTETDTSIVPQWNQCGELSQACANFFLQFQCYDACDPYLHIFGEPDFGSPNSPFAVPLCKEVCYNWYDACKTDLTCGTEWLLDFVQVGNEYVCQNGTVCKQFQEIFDNPQALCDLLWGAYFHYYDGDNCVVWDFEGTNPNQYVQKQNYSEGYCYVSASPTPTVTSNKSIQPAEAAAISLGVILAVVLLLFGATFIFLVYREKKQNPVFGTPMTKLT